MELLPQLPEEGQEEAAEHLANLLPDDQYAAAGQMLTNLKTTEPVMDVLMSDLLNRPNTLKMGLKRRDWGEATDHSDGLVTHTSTPLRSTLWHEAA